MFKSLIDKFDTREKCLNYLAENKDNEFLYFKNSVGMILRNSFKEDNIGDDSIYSYISIVDYAGSDGYSNDEHEYGFYVFLVNKSLEDGFDVYDNIEDAINDYVFTCNTSVKNLLKTKLEDKAKELILNNLIND